MKSTLRHINPSALAIIAEGFLSRLSFGLIGFALPLYALRLGMSLPEIGVLISLDALVALSLKPITGWAADRMGLKRAFTLAIGLRSLVSLLLIFAGTPWHLFGIRALHGLSAALRDPSVNALLAEHGGKKTIASTFAWYSTAKGVAGSLAKAMAGILLTLTVSDFSLVFIIASLLSLLPLYAVTRYIRAGAAIAPPNSAVIKRETLALDETSPVATNKLWKIILPFVGLGVLMSGTANMLSGLFPILATEYAGLTEAQTGMIYLLSTVVFLLSGPMFGWLSDHVSHKLVLLVRSGANTFSSLIYIFFPHFAGVAFGKALDDMGKAAFRPAWGALMAHVSSFDRRRRAQTISYLNMAEDIGSIAAPIIAGLLWSAFGLPFVLGVRILVAVITEAYALMISHPAELARPFVKELNLMNAFNRVLTVLGSLILIAWLALAAFAPTVLGSITREAGARLADRPLLVAVLLTVFSGLVVLEVWPRRSRRVLAQDGQTSLEVTAVNQSLATRLEALESVHAAEAESIGRRKGVEVRLRLRVMEGTNIPALIEQVNRQAQDEMEVHLGLRLLRTRCVIAYAPAGAKKPLESQPAPPFTGAKVNALTKQEAEV